MPLKRFRKPLLLVHITASVALLGATSSSLLLAIVAATDDELAHSAYELMSLQSLVFGIPLSFIALGTGIAVGFAGKWGVLRYRWTAAKLVLMVAVILNGALVLGPTTARRMDGAGSAWGLVLAEVLQVVLLLIPMWLSVYKPGGRLRRAQAARVIATR